jgi:DNA-binding NarL/FixJ family response regulator
MFRENKIRCVLVHDHVLLRQGLRRLLEDEPDLEVLAEAGNKVEALTSTFTLRPDLVIADPATLGIAPADAESLIAQGSPHTKVLFLASGDEREFSRSSNRASHQVAHTARQTSAQELIAMVRKACWPSLAPAQSVPCGDHKDSSSAPPAMPRSRMLTAREREVLKLLAEGRTVRSVARMLGLSNKTVDAHKFNLMRKLGVHNKTELVLWAIQQQLLRVPANS